MLIRDMFAEDINRKINGVIKVDQSENDAIEQELKEYVITKELKKHFVTFFNNYSEALHKPTADIGVWISGFFGSGKSHFLKMLSYLMENRTVNGLSSVECFRSKFEDDPATFMMIDSSTKAETETILFNIDIEGHVKKDKTAVLRVFSKMFYNHIGFYGGEIKIVKLEQYIEEQGKTEEFRRVFEEKRGKSWMEMRKAYAFNGKYVIETLVEVLGMSEEDAKSWVKDKSEVDFSIAEFVEDIKKYTEKKPENFRLLFMVDEVGQYIGTDTDMLLNLQSLVEKIGSECNGKVWVVCTGQEAIDEIIKVRADEFSRIQARFTTRLSLSSSSVDEVIQKRILKKSPDAEDRLENVYAENDSVMRNLFSFTDSVMDIKGFTGPEDFTVNFPFVPYQFIVMQKVFAEIRKHGNSGKHLSGGERSMLSGFQEASQKIQEKDEFAIVPFYSFYDTVHSFLDSSIRRVIERCQKAADNSDGIKQEDVNVLKLLYLIRYIDDIPANIDNISILMAEDIRMDKISMREQVRESLNRLMSQNYIGRTGDIYNFLTDEEQDIQREIRNTSVDTSSIVQQIGTMIYGDLFSDKKFRYGKNDFSFDKYVDGIATGSLSGGMRLRFLTVATDEEDKSELRLRTESKGKEAIVVLAETAYYESLERAMKIRKYVKQRNISTLAKSVQDIIKNQQEEASREEKNAMEQLKAAIENAEFYADGEHLEIRGGNARSKIEDALNYLVSHIYSELDLIKKNYETDAEILEILNSDQGKIGGVRSNSDAGSRILEFLEIQDRKKLPTSMADIQSRYSAIPYGWKEIDIAATVAELVADQKVTIKYAGMTIQPDDQKLPGMLRKKSEVGKTEISIRKTLPQKLMISVRGILQEYFDVMDVPSDEDRLVKFIVQNFEDEKEKYEDLLKKYENGDYPDKSIVLDAIRTVEGVLDQKKDNIALIQEIIRREDELFDSKEDMQIIEGFFANQVDIFDKAVKLEQDMKQERPYLAEQDEATDALNKIRLIVKTENSISRIAKKIPELNMHMSTVDEAYTRVLDKKRDDLLEVARLCMSAIHAAAGENKLCKDIVEKADNYIAKQRSVINEQKSVAVLDSMISLIANYKDDICHRIECVLKPVESPEVREKESSRIKTVHKQMLFPAAEIRNEEDVDKYLERIRKNIMDHLNGWDGIRLS